MGFLALATQLDHVLLGPQRIFRAQGRSADEKSLWIQSDRTTFALPFRRDRVEYDGATHGKTFFSPVGLAREKPLHIHPLQGPADRNVARFNGFELYPIDAHGRVLVRVGNQVMGLRLERGGGTANVIAGVPAHDGAILRKADGTLRGTLEPSDGKPVGCLWEPARLRDRMRDFIRHPVCLINPRLLLTLIASGVFDTAWYYIGKDVGRREAEYHAGLAPKPKHVGEKRILATTLLPLPISAPTSPQHILEQTATDAGLAKDTSSDAATTQLLLARSLPMPGNIAQFIAGINANAAPLSRATNQ